MAARCAERQSVTGGGWDSGGVWRPIFGWDRPVLRELFGVEVFRFLREKELPSAERMQLIRSWRYSGFGVHVGEAIGPGERQALEHVARYLLRAPVSLELSLPDRGPGASLSSPTRAPTPRPGPTPTAALPPGPPGWPGGPGTRWRPGRPGRGGRPRRRRSPDRTG
jgi:hypothetical protein